MAFFFSFFFKGWMKLVNVWNAPFVEILHDQECQGLDCAQLGIMCAMIAQLG